MRSLKVLFYSVVPLCLFLCWGACEGDAFDDGFSYDKKFEGKYTTAYCAPGMDLTRLAPQLNLRPSDEVLTGRSLSASDAPGGEVAPMLDTLFLQVSDILDMRLRDFKIDIKICAGKEALARLYKLFFGTEIEGRLAFYVHELKTIYIAVDDFHADILGREMSRAIIAHYFGIPAPAKVQEVLSLYAEYTLKRQS
ncbi:MAG: hypothetical protein KTQ49_05210 [Candidatus Omnitrophica bacterium]|nr:hypothetical protein [Candidatus Omnitrophota bacterium]